MGWWATVGPVVVDLGVDRPAVEPEGQYDLRDDRGTCWVALGPWGRGGGLTARRLEHSGALTAAIKGTLTSIWKNDVVSFHISFWGFFLFFLSHFLGKPCLDVFSLSLSMCVNGQ